MLSITRSLVLAAVLLSSVVKGDIFFNTTFKYKGVPSGGVRSPCPGLNLLANHGVIPNSGLNVTVPSLLNGIMALGLAQDAALALIFNGISRYGKPIYPGSPILSFNLNDTGVHEAGATRIWAEEHDASLTRIDAYFGNAVAVQTSLVQNVTNRAVGGQIGFMTLAQAYKERRITSATTNPSFLINFDLNALFEQMQKGFLFLYLFGNPLTKSISTYNFNQFFLNERVPDNFTANPPLNAAGLLTGTLQLLLTSVQLISPAGV
ncbi:hypothetical protein HDU76_008434 [Blyttiomyces sp. JEL0837]|nr:hypothetical protein HDU76_008434 [Blyttiomyces sp. JEL0837]